MYKIFLLALIITQVTTDCPEEEYMENGRCSRCRRCMRRQTEIHKCSKLHDRICECPLNEYFDQEKYSCQICAVCDENTRMISSCKREEDTRCILCPENQISPGNNSMICVENTTSYYDNGSHVSHMNWWVLLISILWCLL